MLQTFVICIILVIISLIFLTFWKKREKRRFTRLGVYGVIVKNNQIILITKKGGIYKGLLDLPGGGVEFGETPEQTLRRELREEICMTFDEMHWLNNFSHCQEGFDRGGKFSFHHFGLVYLIMGEASLSHLIPEENFAWYNLSELSHNHLTPFAREAIIAIMRQTVEMDRLLLASHN